jgi:hypothetical protein
MLGRDPVGGGPAGQSLTRWATRLARRHLEESNDEIAQEYRGHAMKLSGPYSEAKDIGDASRSLALLLSTHFNDPRFTDLAERVKSYQDQSKQASMATAPYSAPTIAEAISAPPEEDYPLEIPAAADADRIKLAPAPRRPKPKPRPEPNYVRTADRPSERESGSNALSCGNPVENPKL